MRYGRCHSLYESYKSYHQTSGCRMMHFIGVPLIVSSLVIISYALGARFPWVEVLASCFWIGICLFYARLLLRASILIGFWIGLNVWMAVVLVAERGATDAGVFSLSCFGLGWVLQFVGHYFEQRRPAFFDDLAYLAIAPLFVAQELIDTWYD